MKLAAIFAILFSLGSSIFVVESTAGEPPRRYQVESCIVEYALSGFQKGTETLYLDDWGRKEAKYTNTELSMMGVTQKTNKVTIMDNDWIYNVDLNTNTGTRVPNNALKGIAENSEGKDMTEVGEEMMVNMGGVKVGTEDVAGKTCDVWEIKQMNTKTWIWKGVTLKSVVSMPGMETTSTATSVEENADVPKEKLGVPAKATITEGADVKNIFEKMKGK